MIALLAGRTHSVHTGVLCDSGKFLQNGLLQNTGHVG